MSEGDLKRITDVISMTLRERFKDVSFDHVEVIPEVGDEGEHYLMVYAVFDETQTQPDAPTMGSFVRHLRPRLEREANSAAFPVMCYVAKSEFRSLPSSPAWSAGVAASIAKKSSWS